MRGREKGKLGGPKWKREKVGSGIWVRIPLGHQTALLHARTNETKRFPSRIHPPTSDKDVWLSGFSVGHRWQCSKRWRRRWRALDARRQRLGVSFAFFPIESL